jgi:hypothetical protein
MFYGFFNIDKARSLSMEEMKMKKMLALLAVLVLPCVASAWDYNADFSLAGNPNGVWSYGTFNKTTGEFLSYQNPVTSYPNIRWESTGDAVGGPDRDGCVTKDMGDGSSHPEWQPGQEWYPNMTGFMSPITDRTRGTGARFTAPTAGTYDVNIVFENRVILGYTTEVYVNVNGGNVFSSSVTGFKSGEENFATFDSLIALAAGGTIDFFNGSDQNSSEAHGGGDHLVGVQAVITPEPFTMALLGLGGMAMLRRRR